MPKADLWVIFAVLSTVIGYCAKTYFTLSNNFCCMVLMHMLSVSVMAICDPVEVFL